MILNHYDWGPIPLWQENDGGYLYSAFWAKGEAKAVAAETSVEGVAKSCVFWFEDDRKPISGKFTYTLIDSKDDFGETGPNELSAFLYRCRLESKFVPYAVSFPKKGLIESDVSRVTFSTKERRKIKFNTTVCVAPSPSSKVQLLEFLSYHQLVGVDSFVIYDGGIPYRLKKIITNMSSRLGFKVAFLPWNYPRRDSRIFFQEDCVLRTINESRNVIPLSMDEYVVPTKHSSLNGLLEEFKGPSEKLNFPVLYFCVRYRNKKQPVALQNTRVSGRLSKKNTVYSVFRNSGGTGGQSLVNEGMLDKGFASIHKYVECNWEDDEDKYSYNDNSIMKYSLDFSRSTLVVLLNHEHI